MALILTQDDLRPLLDNRASMESAFEMIETGAYRWAVEHEIGTEFHLS